MQEKDYSLVFCRRESQRQSNSNSDEKPIRREILLGMKKRGFGCGKWNGFGGKLEPGETIERCALRELEEESGLIADASSLRRMGFLVFKLIDSQKIMRVHVYESWLFKGSEVESDEMRPQWFGEEDLPFDEMWQDDKHWLPLLLQGHTFVGRFEYEDEDTLTSFNVKKQ